MVPARRDTIAVNDPGLCPGGRGTTPVVQATVCDAMPYWLGAPYTSNGVLLHGGCSLTRGNVSILEQWYALQAGCADVILS